MSFFDTELVLICGCVFLRPLFCFVLRGFEPRNQQDNHPFWGGALKQDAPMWLSTDPMFGW